MYVTAPNECYALDAGTGRRIWHFKRPRTKGVTQGGANRGAGIAGDRLFMQTDHAHTIALNRIHWRTARGTPSWPTGGKTTRHRLRRCPPGTS